MTENDHREEALDEYVRAIFDRTSLVYRVFAAVVVVYTVFQYGWLAACGVYLGALLLFPVVIAVTGYICGMLLTDEKLNRLTRAYHVRRVSELIEQLGLEPSDLTEEVKKFDEPTPETEQASITPSESVIGRYMDSPIHEWVDATVAGTTRRFFFDAPAQKKNGEYVMPDGDCVLYGGLIYSAELCTSAAPSTPTTTSPAQ
jgi:hypothetical protein